MCQLNILLIYSYGKAKKETNTMNYIYCKMEQSWEYIAALIIKRRENKISEAENIQLAQWRKHHPENQRRFEKLNDENYMRERLKEYDSVDANKIWNITQGKIRKHKRKRFARIVFVTIILLIVLIAVHSIICRTLSNLNFDC